MEKYSILDLCPITAGDTASSAFNNSLDLVRHAESWGFQRYWVAEHHNMQGIASSATSVVMCRLASATSKIRIGAGGIMLPNHAPLVVAEQFGTLVSMFGDRIDLGVGRAPGGNTETAKALRQVVFSDEKFLSDFGELISYFDVPKKEQRILAVPGAGLSVPIYVLSSSLFGAQVAAAMGLPYVFASHFSPDYLLSAIKVYRDFFTPSDFLKKPYLLACMNVCLSDSDLEAKKLFTSTEKQFLDLFGGLQNKLSDPSDIHLNNWGVDEKIRVKNTLKYSAVGGFDTVKEKISDFVALTQIDELLLTSQIFDHSARLESFEGVANICKTICLDDSRAA